MSDQLQMLYLWRKNHWHPLDEPQKVLDALVKRNIAVNAGDTITASIYREKLFAATISFHE